jgi:MFS family permease
MTSGETTAAEASLSHSASPTMNLPSKQEHRFHAKLARMHKRNFRLGVSNGVLYGVGMYFASKTTVIPSFFAHLTHSSALIGLVSQFETIGWYLPQFIASTFIVHRIQKMPIYHVTVWIRGFAFLGLAAATFLSPFPLPLLWLAIFFYGIITFSSGISGVVFVELVAKAIPPARRGRFLSLRISLAALLTATIGAGTISAILSKGHFPSNFALIFLIGAVIATTGLALLGIMREPRTMGLPEERTIREQFAAGRRIYRTDKRYRTYIKTRLLMGSWTIGVPFLVIFAHRRLGFSGGDLGIFIAADCIGTIAANFLWERLTDKRSAKTCLRAVTIVGLALPVVVLMFLAFPIPRIIYAIVFSIAAAVDAGTTIGGISYLIEISPERDRATYIGLFNSLMALPCFLSAGAGLILDLTGFGPLYALVFGIGIASLFAVRKLEYISKH